MKLTAMTLSALALTLTAATCFAEGERPYGMAGCGLGSVLMGKDGNQVLAMTTEATTPVQTFAITSGTSNCVDGGVVKKKKQVRMFIESNQQQLANDISKGGGETVADLARLYNCSSSQAATVGATLQRHFQTIFPETNTSVNHVESSINDVIHTELADACVG